MHFLWITLSQWKFIQIGINSRPNIGSNFVAACPELASSFEVCVMFDETAFGGELCRRVKQFAVAQIGEIQTETFFKV